MANTFDEIEHLRTRLIDASSGYHEGADLAERADIVALFISLRDMHDRHAHVLSVMLAERGVEDDDDESLLAVVHKSILTVRALVTGLDENVIHGLIDGEERIITLYDRALDSLVNDAPLRATLAEQRAELEHRILEMREGADTEARRNKLS
jgi:uncharacterized protein (TIGR02284 family)